MTEAANITPAAARMRRARSRRRDGRMIVPVEVDPALIEGLIDAGRLGEWNEANRDAIGMAIAELLAHWKSTVTRNGADPVQRVIDSNE